MRCVPRRSRHRSAFALEKLRGGVGSSDLGDAPSRGGVLGIGNLNSGSRFALVRLPTATNFDGGAATRRGPPSPGGSDCCRYLL